MASSSGVSYNDTGAGGNANAMGYSVNEETSSQQSAGAAVASFLANQFGRKFVLFYIAS